VRASASPLAASLSDDLLIYPRLQGCKTSTSPSGSLVECVEAIDWDKVRIVDGVEHLLLRVTESLSALVFFLWRSERSCISREEHGGSPAAEYHPQSEDN
jgi:hypothetical protein